MSIFSVDQSDPTKPDPVNNSAVRRITELHRRASEILNLIKTAKDRLEQPVLACDFKTATFIKIVPTLVSEEAMEAFGKSVRSELIEAASQFQKSMDRQRERLN